MMKAKKTQKKKAVRKTDDKTEERVNRIMKSKNRTNQFFAELNDILN